MANLRSIPARPPLRYFGGKWQLADWIMQYFPQHKVYVEPFGGGASVLLQKPPAFLDVYNDLNGDVVNFFKVLRNQEADLIRAIELTPYSREEHRLSKNLDTDTDLERARKFYVWSWQGRGRGGARLQGGWRFMRGDNRHNTTVYDWNNFDHLWSVAYRLKQCQIENKDALNVIKAYDGADTLFYVDPPYLMATRGKKDGKLSGKQQYAFDFTLEQHRQLAYTLNSITGMAIVSGYNSAYYDELYPDWIKVKKDVKKDNNAGEATEFLWISPKCRYVNLFSQNQ